MILKCCFGFEGAVVKNLFIVVQAHALWIVMGMNVV